MLAENVQKLTKNPTGRGRPRATTADRASDIYRMALSRGDSVWNALRQAMETGVSRTSLQRRLVELGLPTPPPGRPPVEIMPNQHPARSIEEIKDLLMASGVGLTAQWEIRRQTIKAGRSILREVSELSVAQRLEGVVMRVPDGDDDRSKLARKAIHAAVAMHIGKLRGSLWIVPHRETGQIWTTLVAALKTAEGQKDRVRRGHKMQRHWEKQAKALRAAVVTLASILYWQEQAKARVANG